MGKHTCDDFGNTFEEREPQKDGSVKVWVVTTCSICGNPRFKDLDRVE